MTPSIHASAIVVGERGVLIRGASGAGKSLLSLAIISRVTVQGRFAALVGDDRIWLETAHGRLIARGAAKLAGVCERRGQGLVETPHETAAVIRMVVDIARRNAAPPRLPGASERYVEFGALRLPRLTLDLAPGLEEGARATLAALSALEGWSWRENDFDGQIFA